MASLPKEWGCMLHREEEMPSVEKLMVHATFGSRKQKYNGKTLFNGTYEGNYFLSMKNSVYKVIIEQISERLTLINSLLRTTPKYD